MPTNRKAWNIVALLAVFMMINTADRAVLGLAGPYIIKDLGLTNTQFGLIGSSFFLLYSLSAVAVGFLANRVSSRLILTILVAVWSLAQAPLAWTMPFEILILTRVALGAGEGPGYPVALNAVYKWFPDEKRTFPSAVVAQGATFGVVLLVPLLNWIIVHETWHMAFAMLAGFGALWMVFWLAFGGEGPLDQIATSSGAAAPRKPYGKLVSDPIILGVWIGGFGAFWSYSLMITWLPSYFATGMGVPKEWLGALTVLPWLANTFIVLLMGWLSQVMMNRGVPTRYSRVYLALFCVLAGGLLVSAASIFTEMRATERLALLIAGVALPTVILTLIPPIVAERVPASQRAGMIAIGQALVTLAGVIAPAVTGRIVDTGSGAAQGFELGFLLCGAILTFAPVLGIVALGRRPD
ncbi:MAG: MFS transporter [Micropepsaceae bacterium]